MDKLFLDTEYNGTANKKLNLVCCSDNINGDRWLHRDEIAKKVLAERYFSMRKSHTFVSYSVTAEARAFLAMGLNPLDFKWIDLYLEWRMLTNHNDVFGYGKQLINGRVVRTRRLPAYSLKNKKLNYSKCEHNLAACTFKLLGVQIDTEHKTNMRNLIISAPEKFSEEDQKSIMDYCASDIKYLPKILDKMNAFYKSKLTKKDFKGLKEAAHLRGEFAARTAIMERVGYPIDVKKTRNFSRSTGKILSDIQTFINKQFPEITPFERKSKKDLRFAQKEKKLFSWIETLPFKKNWPKTAGGKYSLALDSYTKFFDFSHNYPDDNFGAQMVRLLKTKQSLNGFMPREIGAKRKSFWESVGTDGRVRPFLGIYGAQSSRSQPSATGFIPLKAAWMRALISPPKGKAICGIDYGSQEFLLAGLVAKDTNMISAYESGDVYLWAAKQWGIVPMDGTKEEYQSERDQCKSAVLGIGYGMGAAGLARNIENNTGVKVLEEKAAEYIQNYDETFSKYSEWKVDALNKYKDRGYLILPDGWIMFGDNDNDRSTKNCPIQGLGAAIMRKAVQLAQAAGLKVIFTLHDAIYIEYDKPTMPYHIRPELTLKRCMDEAFRFYFEGELKNKANVRMDGKLWGFENFEEEQKRWEYLKDEFPVKVQNTYIDGRSKKDYERFKKYFEDNIALEIL